MQPDNQAAPTHSSDKQLVRVQAVSGALFALFLLVHLCNQMLAALGPQVYDGAQRALRRGYQSPPIELALVIIPMVVHAVAGILRITRRRLNARKAPSGVWARAHRYSGIVLLIFFAGHVIATRGASLFYETFPEFAGIAFTLRWVPMYFWPYYTAFSIAGLYHAIYGLGVALPVLGMKPGTGLRRPLFLVPIITLGSAALIAGMLGFGGVLAGVGEPEQSPYARLLVRLGVARPVKGTVTLP